MKVKGELFYNMATYEIVEFSPRDVYMVFVQDCEIADCKRAIGRN